MNLLKPMGTFLVVASLSPLLGCEREAVGETYAGQIKGGPSVELSWNSPPRAATEMPGAPAQLPESQIHGTVPPGDPSIIALLAGAGTTLRDNAREVRMTAPAIAEAPPAADGTAPPADGTAPAAEITQGQTTAIEVNSQIDPAHRAVIVNSPPPAH